MFNRAFLFASTFASVITLVGPPSAPASGKNSNGPPIKPRGLRVGDTIAFVAPSGVVKVPEIKRAKQRLESMGYVVRMPNDIGRAYGYLAGGDDLRVQELNAALADPEVDAVFPVTGGYGVTRILDRIDYKALRADPKIVIGFSDITGLHLAIAAECNMVTFHSPNPEYGLGSPDGLLPFHAEYFWGCLNTPEPGNELGLVYRPPRSDLPIESLRPGVARGRLAGGNLSLMAALMGTRYEVETTGRVLLIEDIDEAPYRVDRMLSQMRLAGKLDSVAAVLLGSFHKCDPAEGDTGLTLDQVFDDYFGEAPYPVLKRFPAGHGHWNATVPLGIMTEVNATTNTVRLLEPTVVVD